MENINDSKKWLSLLREPSPGKDKSIIEQHLKVLKKEREFWKQTFSNTICFYCLIEPPDFSLECRHTICCSCVKIFGHKLPQDSVYTLDFCPLVAKEIRLNNPLPISNSSPIKRMFTSWPLMVEVYAE
jgi:hypothetical protein